MEKFTFLGKKVALSAFLCCFSLVGFAQEDTQTFNFDSTETQEYAAFFKQPSAIQSRRILLGRHEHVEKLRGKNLA